MLRRFGEALVAADHINEAAAERLTASEYKLVAVKLQAIIRAINLRKNPDGYWCVPVANKDVCIALIVGEKNKVSTILDDYMQARDTTRWNL